MEIAIKFGIEHVWKILLRFALHNIALGPSERHAEIKIWRQSKRRRACISHGFVGPGTERVEAPVRKPLRNCGPPCVPAAIFPLTRFCVRNAIAVLNQILIEPHRIDPLGKKTASVGVDEPEGSVAFGDPKISTRPKIGFGNSAPSGSWYLR